MAKIDSDFPCRGFVDSGKKLVSLIFQFPALNTQVSQGPCTLSSKVLKPRSLVMYGFLGLGMSRVRFRVEARELEYDHPTRQSKEG